jgi:dihydropteroate synthase-like protein
LKVLVITGILAEETVKHYVKESSIKCEIRVLKVPVAAFLTPKSITSNLRSAKLKNIDVILAPGLIRGDTKTISNAVGVPAFKGPRYAADLPMVLDSIGEVELSTTVPACDLLKEKLRLKAFSELEKVESNRDNLLKKTGNILLKNMAVGRDFPMRIMAEIVDAPLMEKKEVQRLAEEYAKLGADIIDVGMIAGEVRPGEAKNLVKAVKQVVNVPVSIDTLNPDEIREALAAGADLVLSGDAGNLEDIAPFVKNVAVVIIPTNQRKGYLPNNTLKRVHFLEELIVKAKQLGITKVIGDLILEPSNIIGSLIAFNDFARRNPDVPLFVGVSNVTELMDADSVGVNALLARISSEIGASILLATEKSDKARGTVREQVIASKMMFLAKKRGSVPKDLGIDLLFLKDKRNREEPYNEELERNVQVISAFDETGHAVLDTKGSFRIALNRIEGTIVAMYYAMPEKGKPTVIIKGKNAENIYSKITELTLVSKVDHAAYLGSELEKAEIALKTGKEYIQDKTMF